MILRVEGMCCQGPFSRMCPNIYEDSPNNLKRIVLDSNPKTFRLGDPDLHRLTGTAPAPLQNSIAPNAPCNLPYGAWWAFGIRRESGRDPSTTGHYRVVSPKRSDRRPP